MRVLGLTQSYDWDLLFSLCTEFVCTTVFILAVYSLGFLQMGPAVNGLVVFFAASTVIYAFGPRCGAPFNPAIVLGLMVGGKINIIKGVLYILVELVAGLLAGAFFITVVKDFPNGTKAASLINPLPGAASTNLAAIFMEFTACFILVLFVFRCIAGIKTYSYEKDMSKERFYQIRAKRQMVLYKCLTSYPLGIAAALGFLSYASSYVSGGAYNPAYALGACVAAANCSKIWVFFLGDFFGGAAAGLFHYWFFEIPRAEEDVDDSQFFAIEGQNL